MRNEAGRIAASIAESCDAPHLEAAFRSTLESIADCLDGACPVDFLALREAGLDDAGVSRALRGIMFVSMETLREYLDESPYAATVLALRQCIHRAIPRPPINAEDREFYRRLMLKDCEGVTGEYRRLALLFHDVAMTFRDIIYVHDMNGSLLYVNPPGLELTKYTIEDVLSGLSIFDFIVPEYVELVEDRMETPASVSRAPYTSEIYAKDGSRVPFEITTRCLLKNRHIVGIVGLARDLRLARRIESELRRSNAVLDSLLLHTPAAIVQIDENATVVDANPAAAALLGHGNAASLIGAPFYHIEEDENALVRDLLQDAMTHHEVKSGKSLDITAATQCDLTVIPILLEGRNAGACVLVFETAPTMAM